MQALIRFVLLIVAVVISVAIVAAHGVRGIALLVGLALVATLPRTRGWKMGERWLVRITGSRRRAIVVVMMVAIGAVIAVNVYQYVH
jgi:hypothetical protein